MKNKILTCALCLTLALIFILTLSSCEAEGNSAMKDSMMEESYPGEGDKLEIDLNGSAIDKEADKDTGTERKIIKTANISAETKKFDEALTLIKDLCDELGGYIESSSTRGVSINSDTSRRYAEYTLRIPAESFDSFNDSLGGILNIVSSSSNVDEVTSQYYDIQSRIGVLELQKESLEKMYENYTDYKDIYTMLELQDKLYSVIEEIEAYKTQLRLYDGKVAYSTVHLSVNEVVEYTENQNEKSFGDKLGDAFKGGWNVFVSICQGIAIVFVAVFPTLLLLGAIAGVTVFICVTATRRARKKKASQKINQDNENKI